MTRSHMTTLSVVSTGLLMAFCAPANAQFSGVYDLSNWTNDGIPEGTTSMACETLDYSYEVNLGVPGDGVPAREAGLSISIERTGTATFDWTYTGNHASFLAFTGLTVDMINGDGTTTTTLVPYEPTVGFFSFSGTATIPVTMGSIVEVRPRGQNVDSISQIFGTVTMSNFRVDRGGFIEDVALDNWTATPMPDGAATITPASGEASTATFEYVVETPDDGEVTERSATFTVPAAENGVVTMTVDYEGFHASFGGEARLELIADSPAGIKATDLVGTQDTGKDFSFTGITKSIAIYEGFDYGIRVTGSTVSPEAVLLGTITVQSITESTDDFRGPYDAAGMTDLGISEGATDLVCTAANFCYDVDLGDNVLVGVPERTTEFCIGSALEPGFILFDWNWTGSHAFSEPFGSLEVVFYSPDGTEAFVATVFDGNLDFGSFDLSNSFSEAVLEGETVCIRIGGGNFDANSFIRGCLNVSNLSGPLALPTPCPADFDNSGAVDFNDIVTLLAAYGPCPGCAADLTGDDEVAFDDLVALLAAFGPCP